MSSRQLTSLGNVAYFSIGQMRKVGTFQKNTPVTNSSGGQDDSYSTIATVRGRLVKQSGRKAYEQSEIVVNKNYEWICRYDSDIVLDTDTILIVDSVKYRINDYELIDEVKHIYRMVISRN